MRSFGENLTFTGLMLMDLSFFAGLFENSPVTSSSQSRRCCENGGVGMTKAGWLLYFRGARTIVGLVNALHLDRQRRWGHYKWSPGMTMGTVMGRVVSGG
jgi:hypothetical protein